MLLRSGAASRLVIALGNGHGTFQAPVESIPAREAFALTDWNGDGRQDVITSKLIMKFTKW